MKNRSILNVSLLAFVLAVVALPARAGQLSGELVGEYIPVAGSVKTMEVGLPGISLGLGLIQPEQIGTYLIVLKRKDWSQLSAEERKQIAHFLVVRGVLRGLVNEDFTANHVLINNKRDGILYSQGDFFSAVLAGDPTCANGKGTVPLKVEETINIVSGVGRFEGLDEPGEIVVRGIIGNCPLLPGFGQNDFRVIANTGGLEFDPLPTFPPALGEN